MFCLQIQVRGTGPSATHDLDLRSHMIGVRGGGASPSRTGHQIPSRRPARTAPRVGGRGPSARRRGGGRKCDSPPSVRSSVRETPCLGYFHDFSTFGIPKCQVFHDTKSTFRKVRIAMRNPFVFQCKWITFPAKVKKVLNLYWILQRFWNAIFELQNIKFSHQET